ncbi:MAG TPA: hypothetical protein VNC39_14130 [Acidocella sp.]|jgi:hypothetical protein|uniref:hypothetical protein n=1 Tax=Acidocella sp. TaxID=50710 RepID=UPI002BAB250C|nr:hypothetical protein [Acidocella sp.]HVE23105.1 hypothetical protein [Acidocella sp.]
MNHKIFDWPEFTMGRVFRNHELPESLKGYGAVIALCLKGSRVPSLKRKGDVHVIVRFRENDAIGGRSSVLEAAKAIEAGATAWLTFPSASQAFAYVRKVLGHTAICNIN